MDFDIYFVHIPVLLNETIAALNPKPNENFVDGTFGGGGHSLAILEKTAPEGKILAIERDAQSLAALPETIKSDPRLIIVNGNYADMAKIAQNNNFKNINGVLLDLGMSSWHIDQSQKGFSFSKDEPLDMRYDQSSPISAAAIVNEHSVADLEKIFADFGQDLKAKKIAAAIVAARSKKPIESTARLAAIVKTAAPKEGVKSMARIFQALRIAVNRELENASRGIAEGFEILSPGGRMAVISFHSLEDRIVKNKFKELAAAGRAKLIFEKPVAASKDEVSKNPRSRSAKLRGVEKII